MEKQTPVQVFFKPQEYAFLEKEAKKRGLSKAALVRLAVSAIGGGFHE